METFSALLAICAGNSPVPVNSPHKGQWRGALMFSLISAWIKGSLNNREAGDLRRNHTHYDVIVMDDARAWISAFLNFCSGNTISTVVMWYVIGCVFLIYWWRKVKVISAHWWRMHTVEISFWGLLHVYTCRLLWTAFLLIWIGICSQGLYFVSIYSMNDLKPSGNETWFDPLLPKSTNLYGLISAQWFKSLG